MNISTRFLADYLLERGLNWEDFEFLSPMAVHKKDILVANWRFGSEIDAEEVKMIFKGFNKFYDNVKRPDGLTYDDFIKSYPEKNQF